MVDITLKIFVDVEKWGPVDGLCTTCWLPRLEGAVLRFLCETGVETVDILGCRDCGKQNVNDHSQK